MKYNSIGEQLIAKAQELDPNYKPDRFNDMSEALDVILNNSGSESIFDITPYMTSLSTISVEGYNALREFVTNNKGGIVNVNLGDNILSFCLSGILEDSLQFVLCNPYENSEHDVGYMRVIISSNGHLTIDNLILNQVLANPTESATESLSKVRIGNSVYDIPKGGFFNIFEYYDGDSDKITQEGWNKLSSGLLNGTYCGILYDEIPLVVAGFNGSRTLYTFKTTEETKNISIKITLKSDLTYKIQEIPSTSMGKVWYPLYSDAMSNKIVLTQEQYNEIKTLAENHQLAGIAMDDMSYAPLFLDGYNSFTFLSVFCMPEVTSKYISYMTINSDLTITIDNTTILSSVNSEITEQVIPSITSTGQQNLKLGNGLKIENGILKTNNIPELPSDASTKTYVLKSVNGVLTWSE